MAIVVPITRWRSRWDTHPFFVTSEKLPHHGLTKKLAVDCYQVRALSHERFIKRLGELSDEELTRVKRAMALILDIEPGDCI